MRSFLSLIFMLYFGATQAQIVNAYAQVTAISTNVLTLGAVDEGGDTFEDDEWVIIMQMQDNVIGANTGDNVNFGNLSDIANAGVYEVRQVQVHAESAGTPTTITLVNTPNFTYNFNANSSVQVMTFPKFGAPDYTTTGNMSAKPWDGTTGGVLAFYTPGVLTLAHSLTADLSGFRGAGPNAGGSAGCQGNSNYRVVTQQNMADKGEGIYKNTTAAYAAGMGKILNGGGGGGSHNGGGGGGGNYTAGGRGGPGWNNCNPGAGGLGGLSLATSIAVGRVFMGGGGGAGEGNNNLATDGGIGGGIILIKADEITTTACAGITVSANGESIAFAGNDGGGGAGAAGSIVFEVNTWSINAACPLVVEANGGNGGLVNNGGTHGGGGGGGQGVVFYSTTTPTTNVTTNTNNGQGGCDNNSNPCNSQAGNGTGTDGDGVIDLLTGPLPIELVSFTGFLNNDHVDLLWTTASESNNDFFTLEHSEDGQTWRAIGKVDGAGNSSSELYYDAKHLEPSLGINYYRLRQTDFNGTYAHSNAISIDFSADHTVVYPNPATSELNIYKPGIGDFEITVYNSLGQVINLVSSSEQNIAKLDVNGVEAGIYFVILSKGESKEFIKFTIER